MSCTVLAIDVPHKPGRHYIGMGMKAHSSHLLNSVTGRLCMSTIRHLTASTWSITNAGNWGYMTGTWREATLYYVVILMDIGDKRAYTIQKKMFP